MPRHAKRSYRRRPRRMHRKRKFTSRVKSGVHYFKRKMYTSFNIVDSAAPVHNAYAFSLSSLPNYSEFVNLYESYKISRIKVQFIFSSNSQDVNTGASVFALPNIVGVIDQNDNTALTTYNDYLQYKFCKIRRLDKPMSFYFKPMFDVAAYSGVFTSYAQKTGWIDTSSPSVLHYGLKFMLDPVFYNIGANVLGRMSVYTTYYIKMKNVH